MNEFISWEFIGSFAGAVGATTLLTQVIKHFITKPDPKWFALAVAMLLTLGYTLLYLRDTTPQGVIMAGINGLLVTGASVGLFEGVKSVGAALKK